MTTPGFRPTHVVPQHGMPAWEAPDPARPTVDLDPLLPVQLLERQGDWGHVLCFNGWSAWVDGRRLVAVPQDPPAADGPLTRAADPRPLLSRAQEALARYRSAVEDLAGGLDRESFRARTRGLRIGVVVDGESVWLYDAAHGHWVYADGTRLTTYATDETPRADPEPSRPAETPAHPPTRVVPEEPPRSQPAPAPPPVQGAPPGPTRVASPEAPEPTRVVSPEAPGPSGAASSDGPEPTPVVVTPSAPEPTRVVPSEAPQPTRAVSPEAPGASKSAPAEAPEPTRVVSPEAPEPVEAGPPEAAEPTRAVSAEPPEPTRVVSSEPPEPTRVVSTEAPGPPEPTRLVTPEEVEEAGRPGEAAPTRVVSPGGDVR
ncbi:hypothetical protein [Streptomyces sp. SudanB52_2052]|uniref:hypothetical protein n=1 Tax=Streptomyces sp. SudanB52_2052 TaxID=3035276 RepID=UPI003F5464A9